MDRLLIGIVCTFFGAFVGVLVMGIMSASGRDTPPPGQSTIRIDGSRFPLSGTYNAAGLAAELTALLQESGLKRVCHYSRRSHFFYMSADKGAVPAAHPTVEELTR